MRLERPESDTRAVSLDERLVVRNPLTWRLSPALAALCVLGAGVASGDTSFIWIAAALIVAVFGLRPSLVLTRDGPIVTNLRRRRLRWDEIADVSHDLYSSGCYLTFYLHGGGRVRSFAVGPGPLGYGQEWIRETTQLVARRWEQATGDETPEKLLSRYGL